MPAISEKTTILVVVFGVIYLLYTARKTARQQLDLYDFAMLSTVAIVPAVFVLRPELAYWLAGIAGVEFPFVIMFGMLFAILFVFIHRLTVKLHHLERINRLLVQEISLLHTSGQKRTGSEPVP